MRVKRSVGYTTNVKTDTRGATPLSFPCVQTGMNRLTTEPAPAFLCRPENLCQLIIDLLTGITALCMGPFGDGRSVNWFLEGYQNYKFSSDLRSLLGEK